MQCRIPVLMHILIACVGSAGDVYPFLAIGKTLQERGHHVELLTSPYFRERIETAGLGFVPIGTIEDYEQAVGNPDLWNPRRALGAVWKAVERNLRNGYQQLANRITPDTVLVGSTLAWNSRLVQERLGVPGATVHLSPSVSSLLTIRRYGQEWPGCNGCLSGSCVPCSVSLNVPSSIRP